MSKGMPWNPCSPDGAQAGAGGGGGFDAAFAARRDLSVNGARVDGLWSGAPVLRTQTDLNNAGAFNGGGTGNKAILGYTGFSGNGLGTLQSISYRWQELTPEMGIAPASRPYVNLVIERDPVGAPGDYSIGVTLDAGNSPLLKLGTFTGLGADQFQYSWNVATDNIQVVNGSAGKMPGVPIDASTGAGWPNESYRIQDILATFPNARLVDAASGDGGLPAGSIPAITPAIMVIMGDSSFRVMQAKAILETLVNGAPQ